MSPEIDLKTKNLIFCNTNRMSHLYYKHNHHQITLKEKYFNKDVLTTLSKVNVDADTYDKDLLMWREEKTKVDRMLKYCNQKGDNTIVYKKKEYGFGRFYPCADSKNIYCYQNVYNIVRRLVINGHYDSIDLVNAHPRILAQLCDKAKIKCKFIKEYADPDNRKTILKHIMSANGVDRDIAKKLMLILSFGGSFNTWVMENKLPKNSKPTEFVAQYYDELQFIMNNQAIDKFKGYSTAVKIAMQVKGKKNNEAFRSAMGLYLQEIESQIMLCVFDYLTDHKVKVCSLIHDELLVESSTPDALDLENIRNHIKQCTGFDMLLESKPTMPTDDDFEWLDKHKPFIIGNQKDVEKRSDEIHAQSILKHCPMVKEKLLGVMMYDDIKGYWTRDCDDHMAIIQRKSAFIFPMDDDNKKSNFITLFKPAYEIAKCTCDVIDSWDLDDSKGFLLFKNGVLDLATFEMLEKDKKYHFTKRINRVFDNTIDYTDIKNEIVAKLFDNPFTDTKKRDYFLEKLARGVAGKIEDRQFVVAIGDTACGKGMITKLIANAIGDFASTFDSQQLVKKSSTDEIEKKLAWIVDLWDCRLIVSNEFDMSSQDSGRKDKYGNSKKQIRPINADIIKRLVSNGDKFTARKLHQNAIKVAIYAMMLILANDAPPVDNADDAYIDRANYLQFDRSSSADVTETDASHFPQDKTLDSYIKTGIVKDGFIALMSEYYQYTLTNGLTPKPDFVNDQIKAFIGATENGSQWLDERYEILTNVEEFKKKDGGWDWEKLELQGKLSGNRKPFYEVTEYIYKEYINDGYSDSSAKFGRMLTNKGVGLGQKKINGINKKVRVGIRSSYNKYSLDFIEDE